MHTDRRSTFLLVLLLTTLAPLAASAQSIDTAKCRAKKFQAVAKHASDAFKCYERSEKRGVDPDECLASAHARMLDRVAKLDAARNPCPASVDAQMLADLVEAQVTSLMSFFPKRVFRTSTLTGPVFGGLKGADARCQMLADAAGLGGRFIAMLSDSSVSMRERVGPSSGGLVRIDDVRVADDRDDLFDGTLDAPIQVDETGAMGTNKEVWTATFFNGNASSQTCSDWTSTSGVTSVGGENRTNFEWVNVYQQFCSRTNVALYCIER